MKVQCVKSNDAKTDFMSTHPSKSASKTPLHAVAHSVHDAYFHYTANPCAKRANATSNATTVIRDVKRHPHFAQTSTMHLPAVAVRPNAHLPRPMDPLHARIRNAALNATRAMQNVHQGNAFRPTRPRTVALAIIDVHSFSMALRHVIMESASSSVRLVIYSKITNACPLVLVALKPLLIAISTAVDVAESLKIAITQKCIVLQLPHLNLSNHDNLTSPHLSIFAYTSTSDTPPEPAKRWLSSRSDRKIPKLPSPASDR